MRRIFGYAALAGATALPLAAGAATAPSMSTNWLPTTLGQTECVQRAEQQRGCISK